MALCLVWGSNMTMFDIIRKLVKQPDTQPILLLNMEGMAERNQQRMEAIKREMGEKYILHPSHTKSRLDTPRPV